MGAELLIMFWRVSDCEELVGGQSQEMIGFVLQELIKLWMKSATELMGAELLIMFVLIV